MSGATIHRRIVQCRIRLRDERPDLTPEQRRMAAIAEVEQLRLRELSKQDDREVNRREVDRLRSQLATLRLRIASMTPKRKAVVA